MNKYKLIPISTFLDEEWRQKSQEAVLDRFMWTLRAVWGREDQESRPGSDSHMLV